MSTAGSPPAGYAPPMRILVLGAGFGGLELTTRLSEEFGDDVDVVLVDRSDGFVFGFSKLDVMFGRTLPDAVHHPYRDLVKPGVRFVQSTVRAIDPVARRVETDAGPFEADVLVVALGADLHPDATPGLVEGGNEFYTVPGAFALRDVLADFEGGRVIVGVTSTPFKCPPAPSETALLMHDFLTARGRRERSQISLVMPMGAPIPPSPAASAALLEAFAQRGIDWYPERLVRELVPERQVVVFGDGTELGYDLFLGVPVHRAPEVVVESGLTVDGWIPVDPLTLETSFPGVYAVGDVTSVGTPKAGVFAEGQAAVVAGVISAQIRGADDADAYDGRGLCYLEFGHDQVAKVDVTFLSGQAPHGDMDGPSADLAADKTAFGTTRIQRWFGRSWPAAH
jgi:sulfide:quinone oxidoreductase